ncbi:MAG: 3-dehydroquinate synthase [Candidatus Nanopelagicaceae bacterium]|nr:3-dehydroquinate synthase [Candidatus Nanopelagicaceae bacterium]
MRTIKVSTDRAYEVTIGCDWREALLPFLEGRSRVAIVISSEMLIHFKAIELPGVSLQVFEIPDGENGKNAQTLESLWERLGTAGFTRSDLIIAIGGGATTDIAGFAAATWLRGIDWIAIPTTLAGMVDASVGGKTGMNSKFGKNLIGSFHSPAAVLVDLSWLSTLSDRDFAAGLAEVVKTGFIADGEIIKKLTGKNIAQIRGSIELTEELIARSLQVKASVVGEDFKESFAREILNYGHTMGHAVELHSKYALRHGEAVAIGMIFVAELSVQQGVMPAELLLLHRELLSGLGLPTTYAKSAWPELFALLALDKKSRGKSLRFVALSGIGKTLRLEDVQEENLMLAYERLSS